jgi:hypothetical protein
MGNLTLQIGPCSFLKLRISPWEILFPFLLCLSSLCSSLSSFLLPLAALSGRLFLPSSLCCSRPAREQAALAARVSQRRRAGACAARRGSGGVRARRRCWAGAGASAAAPSSAAASGPRRAARRLGSAWSRRGSRRWRRAGRPGARRWRALARGARAAAARACAAAGADAARVERSARTACRARGGALARGWRRPAGEARPWAGALVWAAPSGRQRTRLHAASQMWAARAGAEAGDARAGCGRRARGRLGSGAAGASECARRMRAASAGTQERARERERCRRRWSEQHRRRWSMQPCVAGCDLARAMQAERDAGQGCARLGLAQEWRWRLLFQDGKPIFRPAPMWASTGRRRSPVWGIATNGARPTKADGLKGRTRACSLVRCTWGGEPEGEVAKRRRRL